MNTFKYEKDADGVAARFASKRGPEPRWKRTEEIPAIPKTVRWDKNLGRMTAQKTNSCVHCHFVPAAQMMGLMQLEEPITDRHLWAYPLPETVGLTLDPNEGATIVEVVPESAAQVAGLEAGDEIREIGKQPIFSIADVQWALHRAGASDALSLTIKRSSGPVEGVPLKLANGWRRHGECGTGRQRRGHSCVPGWH